jgi:hypothetical protein
MKEVDGVSACPEVGNIRNCDQAKIICRKAISCVGISVTIHLNPHDAGGRVTIAM